MLCLCAFRSSFSTHCLLSSEIGVWIFSGPGTTERTPWIYSCPRMGKQSIDINVSDLPVFELVLGTLYTVYMYISLYLCSTSTSTQHSSHLILVMLIFPSLVVHSTNSITRTLCIYVVLLARDSITYTSG